MNKNLIRLEDLPEEIQEKLLQQISPNDNTQIEEAKILTNQNPKSSITINNHNIYNINFLRNEGVINEKQDSLMTTFARAAGKTWKWLEGESK